MKGYFNNLLSKVKQNKNYLFLALPFALILLFIVLYILSIQTQPRNGTVNVNNPTQSPFTVTPPAFTTSMPTIVTNTPVTTVDPETQRLLEQQEQFELEFAQEQAAIQRDYPWFNKLPLQDDNYFVYFDAELETFIGKLYPSSSSQTPVNTQVSQMQNTILSQIQNMGIDVNQYGIEWQVIPEP